MINFNVYIKRYDEFIQELCSKCLPLTHAYSSQSRTRISSTVGGRDLPVDSPLIVSGTSRPHYYYGGSVV